MSKTFLTIGAGPGIGLATARRFAQAGYHVALAARNVERLHSFAEALKAEGSAATELVDASNPHEVAALVHPIGADLEVLHYNAGILHYDREGALQARPIESESVDSLISDTQINVISAMAAIQAALPALSGEPKASVLLTGGGLGVHPSGDFLTLSVGKAAVERSPWRCSSRSSSAECTCARSPSADWSARTRRNRRDGQCVLGLARAVARSLGSRDRLRLSTQPGETEMRTWFITGASRGFGALIAAQALAAGDAVVATARDPSTIPEAVREHPNGLAVALDVTSESQARDAVRAAISRFGRIDILVNNAGFGVIGGIEETSASEVEALFATNVFGLLNTTRATLPYVRAQRSGHVLNFSSIGGYASAAGFGVYCATKFAVEGISEALSVELAPLGIHATVVEPGYFPNQLPQ